MKKLVSCSFLVGLLCISTYSQKPQKQSFVGRFRNFDGVHSSLWFINSDFSFLYKSVSGNRTGKWRYIKPNKIEVFSPEKKPEIVYIPVKQDNGKIKNVKIKLPKIPLLKKVFILEEKSICTLNVKEDAEFCYERIEDDK